MSRIRVAVLGAGILGARHARVFAEQDEAELVAVIDPVRERAGPVAERHGARPFDALDEVWDAVPFDALAVATPDHLHAAPAVAALDRARHVLIEKPLATTRDDITAIVAAAERSPAVAMVNFSQRFVPEYAWIKRAIEDGAIGDPRMVITHKFDRIHVPTRMIGWAASTAPIWFMSSHDLDLIHWYFGSDPVEVVAQETRGVLAARGIDVHDGMNALVRFASGATASLHTSWIHPDNYPFMADGTLQIIGTSGTLTLENGKRRIVLHNAHGGVEQLFSGPHTADEVDGRIAGAFTASVRRFLECIRTGAELPTSPRQSQPIALLQEAAMRSLGQSPVRI